MREEEEMGLEFLNVWKGIGLILAVNAAITITAITITLILR